MYLFDVGVGSVENVRVCVKNSVFRSFTFVIEGIKLEKCLVNEG